MFYISRTFFFSAHLENLHSISIATTSYCFLPDFSKETTGASIFYELPSILHYNAEEVVSCHGTKNLLIFSSLWTEMSTLHDFSKNKYFSFFSF